MQWPARGLLRGLMLVAFALLPLTRATAAQIHSDGAWLRDAQGRVMMLRGAGYSGLEFGNFPVLDVSGNVVETLGKPSPSNFVQMASWGFKVIRLPIAWSYIEPIPAASVAQLDPNNYLGMVVDKVVGMAAAAGIAVVLDMHQYLWSPCMRGNGAPSWTCYDSGGNFKYSGDPNFESLFVAPCDFWDGPFAQHPTPPGQESLRDHFFRVWQKVAAHYSGNTAVIGFDLFNEPPEGCVPPALFEHQYLTPFYEKLASVVRAQNAGQLLFLEPPISRDITVPAFLEAIGDPNVVYTPHIYTGGTALPQIPYTGLFPTLTADYKVAAVEARRIPAPLWVGEFGGNTGDDQSVGPATIPGSIFRTATERLVEDSIREQERHLVGSAVWAYFASDNPFSVVDAAEHEKGNLVNLLARPYPIATAGIPVSLEFTPETNEFHFAFKDPEDGPISAPTEIYVPAGRHYPGGFTVSTSPGLSASFDSASDILTLTTVTAEPLHYVLINPS